MTGIALAEHGILPDGVVRYGMRRLLARRLAALERDRGVGGEDPTQAFIRQQAEQPIARDTALANAQHYEVPTRLFQLMLGPRLKYSACLYGAASTTLAEAEEAMLALSCERAELRDGCEVLELGCGWGSLTLWMAEHYPRARITAVTNSATQQAYVTEQARSKGFSGVTVVRADVNHFDTEKRFDRIVSVEMFEHVRNYQGLFACIDRWLRPDGKMFVHVFSHRTDPYCFDDRDADDWMARYFFSGGTMPSHALLPSISARLPAEASWQVPGGHYSRTLEDWLRRLDAHRAEALEICRQTYGAREAAVWFRRWRMFMMACSELFAFNDGTEWGVSHYRFIHAVDVEG